MRWKYALALIFALLLAGGALAAEVMQSTVCTVDEGEVIEGSLLVVCRELHIDGRVDGSVFGIALTARISGEVTGDVYLIARGLDVTGTLGDDLHYFGGSLDVKSGVEWERGSLVSAAVSINLSENTRVPDDVNVLAYQLNSAGDVGGDVMYAGESFILRGAVGRDVYAHVGDTREDSPPQLLVTLLSFALGLDAAPSGMRVTSDGSIGGKLDYIAPSVAALDGRIQGNTTYTPITNAPTIEELVAEESRSDALRQYFGQVVQDTLVITMMGALLLLIWPALVQRPVRMVSDGLLVNGLLGVGAFTLSLPILLLSLTCSVLVIALLAVLGIDALTAATGITLGLVNIGGGSLFYFFAGYIARMVIAAALGAFILERISAKELTIRDWMLAVAVGGVIVAVLTALPAVGWFFNLLTIGFGLGAVIRLLWRLTRPPVITAPGPMRVVLTTPSVIAMSPQLPPPLVDDTPPARGMDNLPDGFRWWSDE